jgi:hypothetical protein
MSLSRNSGRMSAAKVGDCRFTSTPFRLGDRGYPRLVRGERLQRDLRDARNQAKAAVTLPAVEGRFACPCCGHLTLEEEPAGTYDICKECGWEDDPVEFNDRNIGAAQTPRACVRRES